MNDIKFVRTRWRRRQQINDIKFVRSRWRRWLGNKTAKNKSYWTDLLDSSWSSWCRQICKSHDMKYEMDLTQESVKHIYGMCIDIATMEELLALDNIYATKAVKRLGK